MAQEGALIVWSLAGVMAWLCFGVACTVGSAPALLAGVTLGACLCQRLLENDLPLLLVVVSPSATGLHHPFYNWKRTYTSPSHPPPPQLPRRDRNNTNYSR